MYEINNAQEEDLPPRHARARLFLQFLDVLLFVVVVRPQQHRPTKKMRALMAIP